MSFITAIGTAVPQHGFSQSTIAEFMVRAMNLQGENERRLRALFRATGIATRYSVLNDYGKLDDFNFYANSKNLEPFPTTAKRLSYYHKHALGLTLEAVSSCLGKTIDPNSITHLIVVSCTGMYAPGLDIDLIKSLHLNPHLHRTCINFMGCYASFNALKLGDSFCRANADAKVLIVCTELCTLHFQKESSENNMLANALFADGCAALLLESKPVAGLNLVPEAFYCDLVADQGNDMAWSIGDSGFNMRLSSYVPELIRSGISKLTTSLLGTISRKISDIDFYAIHPGGKRILEVIEEELEITHEQNRFAYDVLQQYGNMSSPTVLFVLRKMLNSLNETSNGKRILSFAFGPGLTLESMVLKIEKH